MIPHQHAQLAPPEYRPYVRRVAVLIFLAAVLGVALALIVPASPHH